MLQEWHLCVKKMCQYNFSENVLREMASAVCSDGCNLVNKKSGAQFSHISEGTPRQAYWGVLKDNGAKKELEQIFKIISG